MNKGKESKPHIGIFGRRNHGKSSLINSLLGQEVAIVSDVAGTTTDPVKKSVEIPGIGPAIIIDTAGIDDEGDLGKKRIQKSLEIIPIIDLAILVIRNNTIDDFSKGLIEKFRKAELPFVIVHSMSDIIAPEVGFLEKLRLDYSTKVLDYSVLSPKNEELISAMQSLIPETAYTSRSLVGDLISNGDVVLLITPIDTEAPEGRMILPQVQAIRDILDNDAIAVVCKEREADLYIRQMSPKPALVITDSQVFLKADSIVPSEIPLTSFSMILARQRGDFENYMKGTPKIDDLKDDDRILILESCTHHVSCDDIGRVKIPRWLTQYTGKKLEFDVVAGLGNLPRSIQEYALVIQCGGCVITRRQIVNRLKPAVEAGIPVSNYGMTIAYIQGIYKRAVEALQIKQDNTNYL